MKTERFVQVLILIAIAGMAGAASFTHVHDWTMHNAPSGTGSWFGWANAVISELTPIAGGIEIRRRKRTHDRIGYPMAIIVAAAVLSLSAQVSQARPTIGGWISSAVPALAFLALVKLVLSSPRKAPGPDAPQTTTPDIQQDVAETAAATDPPATPVLAVHPISEVRDLRPVPTGQLLMSARMTAFAHQRETGQPITSAELGTRMNIPPALAESLLDHLDGTNPPSVTAVNGTAMNGSRP
jgi:hypothetical protein